MKKFIAIVSLLLVLALCVSFAACEQKSTSNAGQNTSADQQGTQQQSGSDSNQPAATPATYTVMAPDGAPALALAKMMKDGAKVNGHEMTYSVIAAANVAASMTNGDADFIIAPTNAGVMQSVNTDAYYLLGVTSWGNLYLVTTNDAYKTLEDSESATAFLAQFGGHSISSIGSNQVPDKSLKYLLGLAEVTATVAEAQTAQVIQNDLISGTIDCAVLGEPAVTGTKALLAKNGVTNYRILGSVSEVWQSLTTLAYPQASVFVKKSVAADAATVAAFETALKASIDYLNASSANAEEMGAYMESRGDNSLKGAIIKQCYLRTAQGYKSAAEAKDDVNRLVSVLVPSLADRDYDAIFYGTK